MPLTLRLAKSLVVVVVGGVPYSKSLVRVDGGGFLQRILRF